jgi:hypothetical protein
LVVSLSSASVRDEAGISVTADREPFD